MPRINRHALYYQLIDVSFVGQVAIIAVSVVERLIGRQLFPDAIQAPYLVVSFLCLLIPALLVFQRWMRDDFSEMLWQRTAGTVLKLLVALPIPIAVVAGLALIYRGADAFGNALTLDNGRDPLVNAAVLGVVRALVYLWAATPILFTFAFQWHRWQAGR